MAKFQFDFSKVTQKIQEDSKKKDYKDSRFWKPTTDDQGKATAIIRFLPDSDGNPFVKYYEHNFPYMVDGTKKFWIRNCINTFGYDKDCPICKQNTRYWNSAFEEDKKIASQRKRKLNFVSNILVIKNPNNPEDEGKIFMFKFGQKIYDKIKDKWFPSEEVKALGDYDEYIPFDLYEGADFKLVVSKQGEFPNYDKSEFGKQKPVGNDKQIEDIMAKTYKLEEFIAVDKFPTNEEVIKALGSILEGVEVSKPKPSPKQESKKQKDDEDDIPMNLGSSEESSSESDDIDFDDFLKTLD